MEKKNKLLSEEAAAKAPEGKRGSQAGKVRTKGLFKLAEAAEQQVRGLN